jgi:anti-anti-sigma factor
MLIEIERDNDICILRITGRIATGQNDEYLWTKARQIKGMRCRDLLLDIHELHSVGSSGIGFFVDLYASVTRNAGSRMVLAGPSPRVFEVLAMTGLSTIIPMVHDLPAAMAFLEPESRGAAGGVPGG